MISTNVYSQPVRSGLSLLVASVLIVQGCGQALDSPGAPEYAATPMVLNDDGGWCWFEDPRAIIQNGILVVGSVASGRFDSSRRGDIEAAIVELQTGNTSIVELADQFQLDDHNSPVFLSTSDGGLLSLFSRHGDDGHFYYSETTNNDWTKWSVAETFAPGTGSEITYSNVFRLGTEDGRIYNFFRGFEGSFKPSYSFSDDGGRTWETGGIVIDVPSEQRHRPYVRYASNGSDEIHLLYTEGHPRDYDNSLYHVFYRDGSLFESTGEVIRPLVDGLRRPEEGTLIFGGSPDSVAWCNDLELDQDGLPVAVYSVQVGDAAVGRREGGDNLIYRYARFDGHSWFDYPLAHAGQRLYPGEDDYAGLAAIHPAQPEKVCISTNADPVTEEPLISAMDGERHYEIFCGRTDSGGASWEWESMTEDSQVDNLRPIVVAGENGWSALLWLRGAYRSYTDYDLEVVGIVGGV